MSRARYRGPAKLTVVYLDQTRATTEPRLRPAHESKEQGASRLHSNSQAPNAFDVSGQPILIRTECQTAIDAYAIVVTDPGVDRR